MKELLGMTQKVENKIKEKPGLNPNQIAKLCESNIGAVSKSIKKIEEQGIVIGEENLPIITGVRVNKHFFHKSFYVKNEEKEITTKKMIEAVKKRREELKVRKAQKI